MDEEKSGGLVGVPITQILQNQQTQSAHKQQQYYIFDQSMIDSVYCSWRVLLYYYFFVFTMSKSLINESI